MATRDWTITRQNDFQTHTDWAAGSGATVAADAVNYVIGTKSVKLTVDDSDNARYMSKNISFNAQAGVGISFYVDAADLANFRLADIWLHQATDVDNGYRCLLYKGTYPSGIWPITSGWNTIWLSRSDFAALGTPTVLWNADNPVFPVKKVSLGVRRVAAGTPSVSFGELMTVEPPFAMIVLGLDDINNTDYTIAFPYLKARNIPGTCFTPATYIGAANRLTALQILEMQAAGWEFAGHTNDHDTFTTALCTISEGEGAVAGKVVITVPVASNGLCTPFVVGEDVYCDFTATGGSLADGTYDILTKDANTVTIDLAFSATTQTVTITHPAATILTDLQLCDKTMRELGLLSRAMGWRGNECLSPTGLDMARQIYNTVRGQGKGALQVLKNNRMDKLDCFIPGDWWSTAYTALYEATKTAATAYLTQVVAAKGVLDFYVHAIKASNPSEGEIATASFCEFVDVLRSYVAQGTAIVVTPSQRRALVAHMVDENGRPRAYSGTLPELVVSGGGGWWS